METKELMFYFFILFFYGFTIKNTNWFQNLITIIYEYNSMNVLFNFYANAQDLIKFKILIFKLNHCKLDNLFIQ